MLQSRTKPLTMYELRGRIVGFLTLVLVVVFILAVNGYNGNIRLLQYKTYFGKTEFPSDKPYSFTGRTTAPIYKDGSKIPTDDKELYTIVFDAGSTGSRIHVFHFLPGAGGTLSLEKEIFKFTKPGLSYYADNPKQGAESLRRMLNEALAYVPKHKQKITPITLKATAGLRLLPEGAADNILNEVTSLFNEYPFPLGGVSVMDGIDEGIFSWITLNFILGSLEGNRTVAALDLGGGSTQLTFVPVSAKTYEQVPKEYIKKVNLFNKKYKLYTHSYLGQGLMAARHSILTNKMDPDDISNISVIRSPCLLQNYTGVFRFGQMQYNVSGEKPTIDRSPFDQCYKIAKEFVEKYIRSIDELNWQDIYIFSYFFDRAEDGGIIDSENGGVVSMKDFKVAAQKYFDSPNPRKPFLGLDLTYIYALLCDGYRIKPNINLHVKKKIKDTEISWALGAAFQTLSSMGLAR
ncbi:hypothetical protein FSP39_002320 [Pinctada imbricata]|uniref:Ectonucleoside triphosphate diphosphohydrolase 5 n=1 Tax=Pinctada imbricata TaxID=66713 RepID=A0AA89BYI1_PINIB|nr:hypothetical protein FSP39_002320 [Pinctada imbricata]